LTDAEILELYKMRSESAITETEQLYGIYCTAISMNMLWNKEDAGECVSEAYKKAWDAIPPQHPADLQIYLGRITREMSLEKHKERKAQNRGTGEAVLLLGHPTRQQL
jgi:RNA polymerase sigma-70 factor (ECF subfamily)